MSENLSEFFIEKAKAELGETKAKREQSIRLFREWIGKHPFINWNSVDDNFIVKHLRKQKFVMKNVYDAVESMLYMDTIHRNHLLGSGNENLFDLYDTGAVMIIPNRDVDGARIVAVKAKKFEDSPVGHETMRLNIMTNICIEREPETQVAGAKIIIDCRGISMKIFSVLPLSDIAEYSKFSKHTPLRVKAIVLVGLPSALVSFYTTIKSMIPQKLQRRIHMLKDETELRKFFAPNVLLRDFGGEVSVKECVEANRKKFIEAIEYYTNCTARIEFDVDKFRKMRGASDEDGGDLSGSFRKLEID